MRKLEILKTYGKRISRKENLKKCTRFGEQKSSRYIQGNIYFGITPFSCLSSAKVCLRFRLICFIREIKGFYQSSVGHEVDPQISWLKFQLRHAFVDEGPLITTTLTSSCHWKTLELFCLRKKRPEHAFLILIVNYLKIARKNILCHPKQ